MDGLRAEAGSRRLLEMDEGAGAERGSESSSESIGSRTYCISLARLLRCADRLATLSVPSEVWRDGRAEEEGRREARGGEADEAAERAAGEAEELAAAAASTWSASCRKDKMTRLRLEMEGQRSKACSISFASLSWSRTWTQTCFTLLRKRSSK
jgi:hypothetical protein